MAEQSESRYGTYRCPVCGYRDAVSMQPDQRSVVIGCSHCATRLEVWHRGPESVRFAVQVAGEPATH